MRKEDSNLGSSTSGSDPPGTTGVGKKSKKDLEKQQLTQQQNVEHSNAQKATEGNYNQRKENIAEEKVGGASKTPTERYSMSITDLEQETTHTDTHKQDDTESKIMLTVNGAKNNEEDELSKANRLGDPTKPH